MSLLHSQAWYLPRTHEGWAQMGRALKPPTGPPHEPLRCPHVPVTGPLRVPPRDPLSTSTAGGCGEGASGHRGGSRTASDPSPEVGSLGLGSGHRAAEPRGGVPAHVCVRGTGAVEPLCELGGLAQASDRTTGGAISLESPRRSLPPEGHTANDTAVTVSLKSRLTPAEAWEVKTRPENGSRPPRV